ncbi:hypothetical protein AGMMS50268_16240 [Spirochaetia bacterium]|nr:hypothetical protein AGMMS50268_16240 [Spirochaetia bacterium]
MGKKPFSLLWDYLFSLIFGDQRHIDITADFLKTLLDLPGEEYQKLTIVNPFLKRMWKKDKLAIVDVRINTRSGRVIHVELQADPYNFMKNRLMYYSSKLLWEQLRRGYDYNRLNQVISIVICNHILIPEEPAYLNVWEMRHEQTGKRFTDLVKIITIELPKVPRDENGSPEWAWLQLFKCEEIKELKMLAEKHPEVGNVVSIVERLNWPKRVRMYMEWKKLNRYDWENIWQYRMDRVQEQLDEARKQTEAATHQVQLEHARKMKARGDSPESIAEITGLSIKDIEEA